MAFLAVSVHQRALRRITFPNIWWLKLLTGHPKSTNVDAIDSFISELMENKALKWKILKRNTTISQNVLQPEPITPVTKTTTLNLTQIFDDLTSNPLVVNIEPLEQIHIDNLLETAIQEKNNCDVQLLFDQLLEFNRLPSLNVIDQIFRHLIDYNDRTRFEQLLELCHKVDSKLMADSSDFLHYKALFQWKLGNTQNSLQSFQHALRKANSPEIKDMIHRLLRRIVDETIGHKSEAVLLAVIETSEYFMKNLNDSIMLCYVWEKSFRSQWFSDQEASKTLFNKHDALRQVVARRINKICVSFLQENRTEQVYQLMELFLKHDMMPPCKLILMRLFDYQFWRQDLRACSEIMQNSIDLNVPLPEIYNHRLLDLLLGRKTPQLRPVLPASLRKQNVKPTTKTYQLKF
ncbi:uncharacterized protein LOC129760593 [Uranotaenia lowii]|uniref:uncharacterized protein LOC129760593 n=1 Tax=Uranotaenia lowii TaxID=190385 RepID=UPI002479AE87|nr:uncharacterized protein LOC129760593 [Uranotaenia lowii]